jgi:hypothetical protein
MEIAKIIYHPNKNKKKKKIILILLTHTFTKIKIRKISFIKGSISLPRFPRTKAF